MHSHHIQVLCSRPVTQKGMLLPMEVEAAMEKGRADAREDDDMFARGEDAVMV